MVWEDQLLSVIDTLLSLKAVTVMYLDHIKVIKDYISEFSVGIIFIYLFISSSGSHKHKM